MEYEKCVCPVTNVDGILATGKQFDLDITLPEDNRTVIYGVVKDCYQDPVKDAVVKLVEVVCECGKEERKPVSHTFTDKEGEFVFGPLCANRLYEIEIWVDRVKHCKVCVCAKRDIKCLKGVDLECPPCKECKKPCDKHDDKYDYDYYGKPCDKKEDCCDKHCDKKEDDCCDKHDDKKEDDYYGRPCDKKEDCCDKKCDKKDDEYCDKKDDEHYGKPCEKPCDKKEDKCCDKPCEKPCCKPCYKPCR